MKQEKRIKEERIDSFFSWGFSLFDKWIQIKTGGNSLTLYFEDNLINSVAVYGLGTIGRRLYEELVKGQVNVSYGIDRNAANIQVDGLVVKTLKDSLPKVDAVVVTPSSFYEIREEIYHEMGTDTEVIYIEDVVDYCFDKIDRG